MRVWIVNYYTSPVCSNPRYLQFAKHFMAKGWDVITFYANYNGADTDPLFKRETINGLDFVQVRAPHYVGNSFARMRSIFSFAWSIKKHCKEFERPDVILHNIHLPFDYPIVWVAKKIGCKYIAEAWDSWPEDFVASGLISAQNPIMKIAYQIEKRCYYQADSIIFTFLGGRTRLIEKGWTLEKGGKIDLSRVYYINNGVDLEQFDKDNLLHPREDEDINRKGIYKVIYLGSINGANHVQDLIEAAEILKKQPKYVLFIYGDGLKRIELERIVREKRLNNVVFKERKVSFSEVPWIVSQATVNIMNYEKGFGRWGVSSGKMFMYLAAGKPIICNVDIKYDNVIKDNQLGVCRDIESAQDFAESIRFLAELPENEFSEMCNRVRECARRFDYNVLAEAECDVISSLVK